MYGAGLTVASKPELTAGGRKKQDPRIVVGAIVDDGHEDNEIVRKVQGEPGYVKRADDALRDAVAKNLSMMLP